MKLTGKDLAALKVPFLVLVMAIAASIALVKFSSGNREQAEVQHRAQLTALQDARSRYQRSGEERETILRYLPAYQQLHQQGFVGTEQRINWLEGLRAANGQAGLFGVTYQLEPQKPFPLIGADNPMAQYLRHSRMKLTFGLLCCKRAEETNQIALVHQTESELHLGMAQILSHRIIRADQRKGFLRLQLIGHAEQSGLSVGCAQTFQPVDPLLCAYKTLLVQLLIGRKISQDGFAFFAGTLVAAACILQCGELAALLHFGLRAFAGREFDQRDRGRDRNHEHQKGNFQRSEILSGQLHWFLNSWLEHDGELELGVALGACSVGASRQSDI